MDRQDELRTAIVAVAVRIAIVCDRPDGFAIEQGELFLAEDPGRSRSQIIDDISALLEEPLAFVPVRVGGATRLLAKAAIASVSIRIVDDPSEVGVLYDRQHRVEIELLHGTRLGGLLLDSSPAERRRVIDHLNHALHFVRLWTQHEHVLINKSQIVSVTEVAQVE